MRAVRVGGWGCMCTDGGKTQPHVLIVGYAWRGGADWLFITL